MFKAEFKIEGKITSQDLKKLLKLIYRIIKIVVTRILALKGFIAILATLNVL
jgi:hypothetical protein